MKSFGPGSGPMLLTNIQCNGDESKLLQCHTSFCSMDGCMHASDVGVVCERKMELFCFVLFLLSPLSFIHSFIFISFLRSL